MAHHQDGAEEHVLPLGVQLFELTAFEDPRGLLTEVFRDGWVAQPAPTQWNIVAAAADSVRGLHVHPHQDDYVVTVAGMFWVGLRDVRPAADPGRRAATLVLDAARPRALTIPRGVAHGFLVQDPATFMVGVNQVYEGVDLFGCRWDDPALELDWPTAGAFKMSPRDRDAPSLAELEAQLAPILAPSG